MSDDKAIVAPEVPDYLKKYQESQPVQTDDADSMASSSISIPRVSLKAKKFRFIEGGAEVKSEVETIVMILTVDPPSGKFTKTYYEGQFSPGDSTPPTCSSSDGIRPDSWVTTPQSETCNACKQNIFGSATSLKGKKSKACRDSKRLWVIRPDEADGTVYGLQVPVTSLKNLSDLGVKIKATGYPLQAALIKMKMNDEESYPIIEFEIAGWAKEELFSIVSSRSVKKDWQGALIAPNPPVSAALVNKTQSAPPSGAAAVAAAAKAPETQVNKDGSIEGTASKVEDDKPAGNVDDALSKWTS